jgi:two-component system nitrogen regulation response regulator GlnG
MKPIWIVDDDQSIRFVLEKALTREEFAVRSFTNSRDVLAALEDDEPQVLVSDIRMPGGSGIDLLNKIKAKHRELPVIIMTAYSDLDSAVSAFQGGAFDYLPKPFDVPKAVDLIRRAVEESLHEGGDDAPARRCPRSSARRRRCRTSFARSAGSARASSPSSSPASRDRARSSSPTRCTSTARARAGRSSRSTPPRSRRTCSSPSCSGHERGAFTGAQTTRRGRFEQADGGTLFLDEIGDMPFDLQTRLLRVLADGQFYRVGGHNPMKSNVRVIAATHQDLEQRVKAGASARTCSTASTSSACACRRCASAPRTSRRWPASSCRRARASSASKGKRLTDAAIARLVLFDYPGNVRQLENICHWLTVMARPSSSTPRTCRPKLQPQGRDAPRPPPRVTAADATPGGSLAATRSRRARGGIRRAPPAATGAARGRDPGWLGGSRAARPRAAAVGRADGMGHADARVRGAADPLRARDDARAGASRQRTSSASAATPSPARSRNSVSTRSDPGSRLSRRGDAAITARHAVRRPHLDERLDRAPALRENRLVIGAVEARPTRRDDP